MRGSRRSPVIVAILAMTLALALGSGFSQPARAASVDVAMFYDDLAPYGQWVDYQNYGPVWAPSNVADDWRPYTDGRWVPTENGYVFESEEPWAWATYHYGNWMPTDAYGWVWSPGRTWYPSTVEWRTTPDSYQEDNSYVGWAPIPPPDYTPPEGYAPAGYYSGMPADSLLTSPFWIFAQAASFLLGLGQPYTPAYSYLNQPCLVPVEYVPVFFGQTVFCPGYYAPSYYPPGYFARGFVGAYSYGPPASFVTRHANINPGAFNRAINYNTANITRFHNVTAPPGVLSGNPALRNIQPQALTEGRPLPRTREISNINLARANLYKPNMMAAPGNVRPLTARIPKASLEAGRPVRGGIPGTALPARSLLKLTPEQQAAIGKVPATQRIQPVTPPLRPAVTGRPGTPAGAFRPEASPGFRPQERPGVTPQERPGGTPAARPGVRPQEQPASRAPERPSYTPPVRPASRAPARPASRAPARPASRAPARPSYTPRPAPARSAPASKAPPHEGENPR
ncbi:MAG: DUF6600 domain-containing protein [Desulfobaccales bacterium]|jgi:hypothetical protein